VLAWYVRRNMVKIIARLLSGKVPHLGEK